MGAAFEHLKADGVENMNAIITAAQVLDETIAKHVARPEPARERLTQLVASLVPEVTLHVNFDEFRTRQQNSSIHLA